MLNYLETSKFCLRYAKVRYIEVNEVQSRARYKSEVQSEVQSHLESDWLRKYFGGKMIALAM